jgi:nitrogen fixation NifU-like protein
MYSEKVLDHFTNPRNYGKIADADGIGEIGNPECGDLVKIFLKIDQNHKISDIKFQTFGCAAAIACSSKTAEMAKGKHIEETGAITKLAVAEALDGLPENKIHCSNLAPDCLKLAIRDYKIRAGLPVEEDPIEAQILQQQADLGKSKAENADLVLDLRGKECPMTFVYTKVALESLKVGQILEVTLNFPPSFINVPNSVKKQELGIILREEETGGIKRLWIKRT